MRAITALLGFNTSRWNKEVSQQDLLPEASLVHPGWEARLAVASY